MPSVWQKASANPPTGQPPPGNSASSPGWPVGTAGSAVMAGMSPPRQTACRWMISARVAMDTVFLYSIKAFGKPYRNPLYPPPRSRFTWAM